MFELGEVVTPAAGGRGGGGASAGEGGAGGGGAPVVYEVSITYGARAGGDVEHFVAMVALSPARIDYAAASSDGADLRFVSATGEPLPHELERWQPGGTSIAWVKLPTAAARGGSFRLRYGDATAPGGANPAAVWSDYVGVYHMSTAGGAPNDVVDASPGANDGTGTSLTALEGIIGGALAFDGSASRVDMGTVPAWDVEEGDARTFSVWFARATTEELPMTLGRSRAACCNGWALRILPDQYANVRSDATLGSCCVGDDENFGTGAPALPNQASDVDWHLLVTVMDRASDTHRLYLDGELRESVPFGGTATMNAGAAALGVSEYDEDFFLGSLDETRVATFAATADEIALRYLAERDQWLTFGPPEAL